MPTNDHARVPMQPKTKASQLRTDAMAAAPAARTDKFTKQSRSVPSRGLQQRIDYSACEPRNESTFAHHSGPRTATIFYEPAKRVFDLAVGAILLIIATPVILIAALAIRYESPGSPFFIQTRLGKDGRPFKIFKLRGMFKDARERYPSYYDYSSQQNLDFCFHHEIDPRVTRAGNFIRKTSIDELPNLWNVVMGDMSLVGPRPEIPEVLALYGTYRQEYLSVKPGVTCMSKCTGRDRLTKRETIESDLGYIRRRNFSLDWQILWRTFRSVMLRRDVF